MIRMTRWSVSIQSSLTPLYGTLLSDYTAKFYDVYGDLEWERLEATPYGRLQATIHAEFIERYVRLGDRVLDAGCGPGRFTAVAARLGATVTALDVSERQLELAKERVGEAKMLNRIGGFVRADISDLSMFPDDHFDVVVCYGGTVIVRVRAAPQGGV